jgi:hypothetical protein
MNNQNVKQVEAFEPTPLEELLYLTSLDCKIFMARCAETIEGVSIGDMLLARKQYAKESVIRTFNQLNSWN